VSRVSGISRSRFARITWLKLTGDHSVFSICCGWSPTQPRSVALSAFQACVEKYGLAKLKIIQAHLKFSL